MTGKAALVIGGGIVGAAAAWRLQRAGFATTVVDPGDLAKAASFGNAGHLATEQVEPLPSIKTLRSLPRRLFVAGGPVALPPRDIGTWLPFGLRLIAAALPARFEAGTRALKSLVTRALPAWHRLAADIGARDLIREQGHFCVWETPATTTASMKAALDADLGFASVCSATAAELSLLRAKLSDRPVGAVRYSNTGQIVDIPALRARLAEAFHAAGGKSRTGSVARLTVDNGRASAILADGTVLNADRIVVASGIGSRELMRGIDGPVPLIAERGYHIDAAISADEWPNDLPPVAFGDRSVIITRFANSLRMTGFTEFSRTSSPPDPRKWDRLERHADELGLPKGPGRTRWIGSRPTLPDYLPAIGRSRAADNLLYAFGHQHLGMTLAAITGELVVAMALENTPPLPLAPFDLNRFG